MTVILRHDVEAREGKNSSLVYDNSNSKPVKMALIREELMALTQDPFIAVVLNQLLYWTQRVSDFDLLVAEENSETLKNKKNHGWLYKSAQELIEETMLHVSKVTMRRYLGFLIEHGWLSERGNPQYKWDRTTQYRLNLIQLQSDLQALGWSLPGFPENLFLHHSSKPFFEETNLKKPQKTRELKIEASKLHESTLDEKANRPSKVKNCSFIYLTETTSKTTNKDHTQCVQKKSHELKKDDVSSAMVELWQQHIGQDGLRLTQSRRTKLQSLLKLHFENDLSKWEEFCKRIKESPFLMGQGANKWHVTFHWILLKDNVLKILEGNFDSPEVVQRKKEVKAQDIRKQKTKEILESIEDPYWKDWCDQLSEFPENGFSPVNKPYLWWQLERITNAKFLDFDGRLVTLGSSDPKVINELENNRFQIGSVVYRTFPTSRGIRTELIPSQTSNSPLNAQNQPKGTPPHD